MALLSDKTITKRCQPYLFQLDRFGPPHLALTHSQLDFWWGKQYTHDEALNQLLRLGYANAARILEQLCGDDQQAATCGAQMKDVFFTNGFEPVSVRLVRQKPLISPFEPQSVKHLESGKKIPSFGISPFGYDIRLGRNYTLFDSDTSASDGVLDVCDFDPGIGTEHTDCDSIVIPAQGFALAHTVEYIRMPRDLSAVCMAKSTLARMGLIAHVTPLEAGWEGYVTIELLNTLKQPMRVHSGIGIMQLLFLQGDQPCETSYADRGGKYQGQAATPIMARL